MAYIVQKHKNVASIIKRVNEIKDEKEAIRFLKSHDNKSVRFFIDAYYNKDFSFMRDSNIKYTYTDMPSGREYSNIKNEVSRLNMILKIGEKNEKTLKIARLVLEIIPEDDAKLIENHLFNHQHLQIDKKVFRAVYPEFFRDKDSQTQN